jgi:hypothetical protein
MPRRTLQASTPPGDAAQPPKSQIASSPKARPAHPPHPAAADGLRGGAIADAEGIGGFARWRHLPHRHIPPRRHQNPFPGTSRNPFSCCVRLPAVTARNRWIAPSGPFLGLRVCLGRLSGEDVGAMHAIGHLCLGVISDLSIPTMISSFG